MLVNSPIPCRFATLRPPEVTSTTGSLHEGVEARRRVAQYALILFAGYLLNFLRWHVLPLLDGSFRSEQLFSFVRMLLMLAFSLGVFRLAQGALLRLPILRRCALLLQLAALFDTQIFDPTYFMTQSDGNVFGISWACVILVVFPMLVPCTVALHAGVALAAVCMTPLYYGILGGLGLPTLPGDVILNLTIPVLICAVLAVLAARIVHRLDRAVVAAQRELSLLGSYQLQERIGAGGMGEVWRGRHQLLARDAAIKVIHICRLVDEERNVESVLLRFEREAQAMAALHSQHTVEIYDYGRTDEGAFFYAMELLDGIDLEHLLTTDGPQDPLRVAGMLRQACMSLAEAHAAQLVHRDIKPANIFICRQGLELDVIKILDFGLVLRRTMPDEENASDVRLTGAHQVYGTPEFMAPEQAMGEPHVDGRADLYALGCVAYYLLTGKLVFSESTPMRTMIAHVRKDPVPLSQHRSDMPTQLDAIIMDCLAKQPEDRPPHAEAIIARLDAAGLGAGWTWQQRQDWWARHPPRQQVPSLGTD